MARQALRTAAGTAASPLLLRHRRPSALALVLAAAATAAAAAAGLLGVSTPTFALGRRPSPAPRARAVPRCAGETETETETEEKVATKKSWEIEVPPPDSELQTSGGKDPRGAEKKWKPKREIRGTICYDRRELNEEAQRFRPHIEPLLERQMSVPEITFVLNRKGRDLRHLLYRPRLGLPVFTEHKVRRLLRRATTPRGRLNKYARPEHFPPMSPAAPVPYPLEEFYAEVPPLKPWTPGEGATEEAAAKVDEDDEVEQEEEGEPEEE